MANAQDYTKADAMIMMIVATTSRNSEQRYVMEALANAGVKPDWFASKTLGELYECATAVWRETQTLDPFMIMKKGRELGMQDPATALTDLIDASGGATIAHLEHYIRAFKQKRIYAVAHKLMVTTLQEMNPDNIGTTLEDFVRKVHDLQESCASGDKALRQLGDYVETSLEKKRKLHEERFVKHNWEYLDGLRWPWKEVDQVFTGLKKGLHIIAALASQGKSTMAVDLSVFWNETGVKHGFFSIDMAADQLADRYPCVMNRVSLAKLNFGASRDEVDRFEDGFHKAIKLNNVWLSEVDDARTMEYQCYRGVKTLGWKAIIIDYIQLVHVEDKGNMPEYTRVQRAVQGIKRIAKKLEVPIICLAQLSRAFEQQLREKGFAPGLDAIGDSAEIARAAASVTCIYRDEDVTKYWESNPPARLAFADPNDAALRYGVIAPGSEDENAAYSRRCGQLNLAKALRPMWFDVKKNQQGRCGRIPFILFPNYFLFRPGNSQGEKSVEKIGGKEKSIPKQMFEQICDDWTYTDQDWWLEMTNALPQRGQKLTGETHDQMKARLERERAAHPEVRHFVREDETHGTVIEAVLTKEEE